MIFPLDFKAFVWKRPMKQSILDSFRLDRGTALVVRALGFKRLFTFPFAGILVLLASVPVIDDLRGAMNG